MSGTKAGRALLEELAESPLPGARYAHSVVSRGLADIESEAFAEGYGEALDDLYQPASEAAERIREQERERIADRLERFYHDTRTEDCIHLGGETTPECVVFAREFAAITLAATPAPPDGLREAIESLPWHYSPWNEPVIGRREVLAAITDHRYDAPTTGDRHASHSAPDGLREALWDAIDVGIYPKNPDGTPDGTRTPWQDGWNAACIAISEALEAFWPEDSRR